MSPLHPLVQLQRTLFSSNIFHSVPWHLRTKRGRNCLRDLKQLVVTRMVKTVVKCEKTEFCRRFLAVKRRRSEDVLQKERLAWSSLAETWPVGVPQAQRC